MFKFEKSKKLASLAFILLVVSLVFSVSFSTIHPTTAQMPEKVATPTFNPVGGTYGAAQHVALMCSTVGASIRYTSDGSEPSSSSRIYSIPIPICGSGELYSSRGADNPLLNYYLQAEGSVTIRAKAFKSGMTDSDIATATYTFVLPVDQVA